MSEILSATTLDIFTGFSPSRVQTRIRQTETLNQWSAKKTRKHAISCFSKYRKNKEE